MAIIGRETTRMKAFYRALLRLYPASFRADYASGAGAHFEENVRDRGRVSRRVRAIADVRAQRDRAALGDPRRRTCATP